MPDEQQPSSDVSATQQPSETPVTGNTSGSATPPMKSTPAAEELLKELEELKRTHGNAKEELDRHRKKLTAYEKKEAEADAARKAAEEAQLSELERTQKQFSDLQAQHSAYTQQMQERLIRYEVERQARSVGIREDAVDDVAKLLDWSELEYDEDGTPKNAKKLLEQLLKNKPYLAASKPQEQQQQTPAQTAQHGQQRAPVIPPFSGRSSIPAPGTATSPGRPVKFSDNVFVPPGTPSPYQP